MIWSYAAWGVEYATKASFAAGSAAVPLAAVEPVVVGMSSLPHTLRTAAKRRRATIGSARDRFMGAFRGNLSNLPGW